MGSLVFRAYINVENYILLDSTGYMSKGLWCDICPGPNLLTFPETVRPHILPWALVKRAESWQVDKKEDFITQEFTD